MCAHDAGAHAAQPPFDQTASDLDLAPEGSHSCVLFDAVGLGDGAFAPTAIGLRPTPPPAPLVAALPAIRAIDRLAFAAARAPPITVS